jgi:hypothetical protein
VDVFVLFFKILYLVRMKREGEDKLWWVSSKRGLFGVKSFYSVMGCHNGFHFPLKSIWRTKVLMRVAFFVRLAALGKTLLWIIFGSGASLGLIGVICAK